MATSRREILPDVYLTCAPVHTRREGILSVHLLTSLRKETASRVTLLPGVLRRGTMTMPDMAALSARLDDLYGARVECSVRKLGEVQAAGFVADFVEGIPSPEGKSLAEEMASLLGEMLLQPDTRGGLLRPEAVAGERQKLLEEIEGRSNDREEYARTRLLALMCPEEAYGVDLLGDRESAGAIDHVSLTRDYRKLLAGSRIEVFYSGREESAQMEEAVRQALLPLPREEPEGEPELDVRPIPSDGHVRYFTETMDVSQGKLVLGFRLGENMQEPDRAAMRVAECMLTGVPGRLFTALREKRSLCYYVDSQLDLLKGVLLISSGIDPENYDEVLQEILYQIGQVRKGAFTQEELSVARLSLVSDYLSVPDCPEGLEKYWLVQNGLQPDCGPREMAALVSEVTAEDVKRSVADLRCDAVYFLCRSQEKKMQRMQWEQAELTYFSGKLANRLPVYVVPRPGRHRVRASVTVRYGGADRAFRLDGRDVETPAGTAHFLEHKMFETAEGSSVDALFGRRGASANAWTSEAYTCFYVECTDAWEENLRTLLEFVSTPAFTPETVERERGIIAQEILECGDDPAWVVQADLMRALFGSHPLGDDVIGTGETLADIGAETLLSCHRAFYTPANMCLCVMGDVEPRKVEEIAGQVLPAAWGPMPARESRSVSLDPAEQRTVRVMEVSVSQFCAGVKLPDGEGGLRLRQRLLAELAGRCFWGESAPVYIELYEQGLLNDTFHVETVWASGADCLLFGGESSGPERAFEALASAWQRGLDPSFFRRQKKALYGDFLRALDRDEDLEEMLTEGTFWHFDPAGFGAALEAVTGEEVCQWAAEYLAPERFSLAVVRPEREI